MGSHKPTVVQPCGPELLLSSSPQQAATPDSSVLALAREAAAAPFRALAVKGPLGCPASAPCCSEYGYCQPEASWHAGAFRDCNGVSNGRPLAPEAIAAENEAIAHGDASAANLLVVPAGGSVAGAAPVAVAPAPAPVAVAPAAPVAVAAPVAPAAVAAGNVYAAAAPVATYAPGVTYNTPYAGYAGAVYPG